MATTPPQPAFKARRIAGGLLDFLNFFSWSVYQPDYYRNISKRDYRMQLLASIVTFVVTVTLITQGVQDAARRPLSEATVQSVTSPEDVAALFEAQAEGDGSVTGLVCPCSQSATPLRAGTSWALPEDSFCTTLRASADLASFITTGAPSQAFEDFLAAAQSPLNDHCIESTARPAFEAAVEAMVRQGYLFEPTDVYYLDRVAAFASDLEASLCGLAFGLNPLEKFYNPVPGATTNDNSNLCAPVLPAEEPPRLVPAAFLNTQLDEDAKVYQVQQTRMLTYVSGTVTLCNALLRQRTGFLAAMEAAVLDTPIALKPEDYRANAERTFNAALAIAGSQVSAFVPGFTPDPYSPFTDLINYFTLPIFDGGQPLGKLFNAPLSYPLDTLFPFSARLPFVRSDYFTGGTRFYYVLAQIGNIPRPILAGEARVRVTAPPGPFPFLQTDDERVTPGFQAGVTQDWVPLGEDLLSLLDACAAGLPLSVDVHTLRPLNLGRQGNDPADWNPPYDAINISEANPQRCAMGAPRPPLDAAGAQPPQPVLFNVPLACPPLLQLLARARSNSSYFNATSNLRFSVQEYLDARAKGKAGEAELQLRTILGDSAQRVAALSASLFSAPLTFEHTVAGHYAACAPSSCSYTAISEPTAAALFVVGVSIFGGTSTTVIMFLALFVYWLSVCGYHCDHLRKPEKYPLRWSAPPPSEEEGGGAGAEGGAGKSQEEDFASAVNPIRSWPGKGQAGIQGAF